MSEQDSIVLLSGGLDSATVLAIAIAEGRRPRTLSFAYGQRHAVELRRARELAAARNLPHTLIELSPELFRGTALVGESIDVPLD